MAIDLTGLRAATAAEYDDARRNVPSRAWRTYLDLAEVPEGAYRVADGRMEEVTRGVAALARRAARIGLPEPRVETLRVEDVEVIVGWHNLYYRTGEMRRFHVLRPDVGQVVLPGWSFVATIEHLGEEGNLLRTVPSFTEKLPDAYRTDRATCDHCRTHRWRTETFVLRHEDGSFRRIGRNCLADYIGDDSAALVVAQAAMDRAFAELLSGDEDDGGFGGGGGVRATSPALFLSAVALAIETWGWLSRKAARDAFPPKVATADAAWDILFPPKNAPVDHLRRDSITEAHEADAAAALAWAREIDEETDSDYLHNCRVIAHQPAWTGKMIGIGAAILMSFQKDRERLKRMEFERRLPSIFLGAVGDRFGAPAKSKKKPGTPLLRVRVLGAHAIEGQYGVTTILRMQAASTDGAAVHDLVWFASGSPQVCTDGGEAAAALAVAHEAERAALQAQDAWQRDHGYGECEDLRRLRGAWADAYHADRDAEKAYAATQRAVRPGDLLDVAGTVREHRTSEKTKRPETILTRCSVALVVEPVEAK